MDRRALFFFLTMTIVLFLMNQWFYYDKTTVDPTPINQPDTTILVTEKGQPTLLNAEEVDKLAVVKLFGNIDLEGPYVYALQRNNVFLGLTKDFPLFEETYYKPSRKYGSLSEVQRIKLRVSAKQEGNPFLYSRYPLLKLEIPWIPSETTFPISMIYFANDQVYEIKGIGEGFSKLHIDTKPLSNAIVLYEGEGVKEPYALYNVHTGKLEYFEHMPQFEDYSVIRYTTDPQIRKQYEEEAYYVLENEYMQLVFSNLNGAIAEINLPFESESHPNSVVKEIEFDRIIAEDYPFNDTFPQAPYFVPDDKGKVKKLVPTQGGYTPLLRRDIVSSIGDTYNYVNPHYYAFNVFQEDLSPKANEYTVKRFEKNLIEWELVEGNRRITKTFILPENPQDRPYTFDLDVKVEGDARHLSLSLGIPEVELISGSFLPTLKYRVIRNHKSVVEEIKPPKTLVTFSHLACDWYCNGNGFFGVILNPIHKAVPGLSVHPVSGELVPSRITIIDAQFNRYPPEKYPGYAMHTPIPSKPGITKYRVFAGPFDKNILETVDTAFTNPTTGGNPEFIEAKSNHGWFVFISKPFAQFLFYIMNFFYHLTGSWGFSIIFLTIVLRVMLYPLNNWSMKSMANMQKFTPKVKEIQEKYKKDPARVRLELMNLYKREGINPLGGCFPILIQLPFMFGMLDLLKSSFQLRGASFIPGWINNLAAPDVLFSWAYPLPFIGTSFHLLPILLGITMYFQQKFTSTASIQKAATDQQRQARFMGNMMALLFTIMFYNFPSGLNIYWISSMLLGILQQWLINKKVAVTKK